MILLMVGTTTLPCSMGYMYNCTWGSTVFKISSMIISHLTHLTNYLHTIPAWTCYSGSFITYDQTWGSTVFLMSSIISHHRLQTTWYTTPAGTCSMIHHLCEPVTILLYGLYDFPCLPDIPPMSWHHPPPITCDTTRNAWLDRNLTLSALV